RCRGARSGSTSPGWSTRARRRPRAALPSVASNAASTPWRARVASGCWAARRRGFTIPPPPSQACSAPAPRCPSVRSSVRSSRRSAPMSRRGAGARASSRSRSLPGRGSGEARVMNVLVQDAGPLTSVQDLGRLGQLRVGLPRSGPMDREAFVLANRLVGNPDNAAGLECTLMGPRLEFRDARWGAGAGAGVPGPLDRAEQPTWTAFPVRAGGVLRIGGARAGVRSYLAISGGVATPPVLGSRATYLRGALGGLDGRALRKGDPLPLGPPAGGGARRVRPDRIP